MYPIKKKKSMTKRQSEKDRDEVNVTGSSEVEAGESNKEGAG